MLVYTTQAEQTAAKTALPVTSFTRRSMLGGEYTCIITSEQVNKGTARGRRPYLCFCHRLFLVFVFVMFLFLFCFRFCFRFCFCHVLKLRSFNSQLCA